VLNLIAYYKGKHYSTKEQRLRILWQQYKDKHHIDITFNEYLYYIDNMVSRLGVIIGDLLDNKSNIVFIPMNSNELKQWRETRNAWKKQHRQDSILYDVWLKEHIGGEQ
jgi:hypothetical protein